jgi:hypothetical protein
MHPIAADRHALLQIVEGTLSALPTQGPVGADGRGCQDDGVAGRGDRDRA